MSILKEKQVTLALCISFFDPLIVDLLYTLRILS